ncbi:fatty acid desaturase CarF family protein [Labrys wisconsinensis]|uniref:Lipid desaturase domain-containing protein n=1 Tax=Labrys wisconsinensis TaxID=425677 RepID=A0ABU0JBI6_9HYPH|nr:fatty acid desaturase CarF family protein [Labrys wisconsinensis]MDQ0471636.1 hypothetical protein [Labrys wisconsinensis]
MKMRLALLAFLVSFAANFIWLGGPLDWRMPLAAVAAWYLADLLSGLIHMYMDYRPVPPGSGLADVYFYKGSHDSEHYHTLRKQALARVGPIDRLAFDFKFHHPRPEVLGRRKLIYQVRSTVIVLSLPFSVELNAACLIWHVPNWLVAGAIVLIVAGSLSQYFHGSLHREKNPWFILFLRRIGLLMTPAAHAVHHTTLERDFSVINGWSNPLVNVIFRFLLRRHILKEDGLEPT